MDETIRSLLYSDENGNITTIDEVQLLDEFPQSRVKGLIKLLYEKDLYISYQATLILTAWGIEEGFMKIREFIQSRYDLQEELEPHRIYDEDNVYDVLAEALYRSTYNTDDEDKILPFIQDILLLYPTCFFESRLKYVLLKIGKLDFLQKDIENALVGAINNHRYFQASQLLPVLHKISAYLTLKYVPTFEKLIEKDKRIKYNIEEIGLWN